LGGFRFFGTCSNYSNEIIFTTTLTFRTIRIFIAGIGFDAVRESEALLRVADFFHGRVSNFQKSQFAGKFFLTTPNPEMVLAAQKSSAFKKVLNSSDFAAADGVGILWASYFLDLRKRNFFTLLISLATVLFAPQKIRKVIPERITGTDLFSKLLEFAAARKKKVFLLGAEEGIAKKVKRKFEQKFPQLEISGIFSGSPKISEEAETRERINESGAELLFVAFGAPNQEMWIARNLSKLKTVKFAAGIGGAFDFHAGTISRAPGIFRRLGLEWLWRLIRQPSRLPRIWNATFRFIGLVWRER